MDTSTSSSPSAPSRNPGARASRWQRSIPLPVLTGAVVVASMLVLAAVLMWQGSQAARASLLSAAFASARDMSVIINEKTQRILSPAEATLRQLSLDPLGGYDTLEERLERLRVLTQVLVYGELVSAVYIGYADGDFLLVRPLDDAAVARQFDPPAGALFLVQSIMRQPNGDQVGEWLFYNSDLKLLDRRAMPGYQFDPRTRPWYQSARVPGRQTLTAPYIFFTSQQIGLSLSQPSDVGHAILGVDLALSDLGAEMGDLHRTAHSEIALVDDLGRVIAYKDYSRALVRDGSTLHFQSLAGLNVPALLALNERAVSQNTPVSFTVQGQDWFGVRMPLHSLPDKSLQILLAVPDADLLAAVRQTLKTQSFWTLGLIALLLPFGWLAGRQVGVSLSRITRQAQQLTRFDFSQHQASSSMVREVKELDAVFGNMCVTMQNFLRTTEVISSEPRLDSMLQGVLGKLVDTTHCSVGAVYLFSTQSHLFDLAAVAHDSSSRHNDDESPFAGQLPANFLDAPTETDGELIMPLRGRQNEILGVLILHHAVDDEHRSENFRAFAQKLSGALSVSLETRNLFAAQQRLLESVIQLLADAIDAKSPYTGGHCERVPELAEMLIDRLNDETTGPYAQFTMSDIERYEFRLGAWLHDCGKVTSPEHIIDKATKLETIYNRIHEIRTRFEVLWRDAQIRALKDLADGKDPDQVSRELDDTQLQLRDDFAFVAACNIGSESMAQADIERLHRIGTQTWRRHFDDRLGLSAAELRQLRDVPLQPLPAQEYLLADKPQHQVPWGKRRPPVEINNPANQWGFDMQLPAYARHLGELYNLLVRRGTLTPEDRFTINDHIIQTYIMLRRLPWPAHLANVPEIAATHHERMDGKGYPRRLNASQLTLSDRVMALADVFEALTAGDRPYKAAKTLTESLRIMIAMAADGHLDPQLLRYFLRSRLWEIFALKFMHPEQIDPVDIQALTRELDEAMSSHASHGAGQGG
ncbi:MAG: HD domain-containing phosphohydrolase [Burkholderiaceae bacterium]